MTDEERNRRFENALTTLSELAAKQEGRAAAIEKLAANHDSRMAALEKLLVAQDGRAAVLEKLAADHQRLFVNHERRVPGLEEAFKIVAESAQRHDEGMDEIRAAQAETGRKLGALVDAQIRTQEAAAESERKIATLVESQAHTDRRLDALIDVVRDLLNGRRRGGGPRDLG